ncbi:hypothetical protein C8A00DRAFT_35444 [Chaetomidium leptoderma]|uniref:Uncharacterized protein n=1 Tax=Chaetomidium leptoderma TaxID=669021 RepID=A0AAN6VIG6_9PEZI|nr:hypothetical protein C8A00DRAFT_35444 [Chaetomidium leptoderma]
MSEEDCMMQCAFRSVLAVGYLLVDAILLPRRDTIIRRGRQVQDTLRLPNCLRVFSDRLEPGMTDCQIRIAGQFSVFAGLFVVLGSIVALLEGTMLDPGIIVATGSLYPAYRLYEDFAGAFTEPLIPIPDGRFQPMSAKIPGSSSLNYTSLSKTRPSYPKTIYTLGFSTTADTPAQRVLIDFANALAKFVNGNVTMLNLTAEWAASKPAEAGNVTLDQFLNTTYAAVAYATLITKDQTALVRDPFYRDYAAAHSNRRPFIDPGPSLRWSYGNSLPATAPSSAQAAKALFQTWFTTHILPPTLLNNNNNSSSSSNKNQCSSSLILYPGSEGEPFPRNLVFSGVPDSVFPVGGEVAALSAITGVEETLPVVVSVLAARGCDGLLARLAQELVEGGVVRVPPVGASGGGVDDAEGVGGAAVID